MAATADLEADIFGVSDDEDEEDPFAQQAAYQREAEPAEAPQDAGEAPPEAAADGAEPATAPDLPRRGSTASWCALLCLREQAGHCRLFSRRTRCLSIVVPAPGLRQTSGRTGSLRSQRARQTLTRGRPWTWRRPWRTLPPLVR